MAMMWMARQLRETGNPADGYLADALVERAEKHGDIPFPLPAQVSRPGDPSLDVTSLSAYDRLRLADRHAAVLRQARAIAAPLAAGLQAIMPEEPPKPKGHGIPARTVHWQATKAIGGITMLYKCSAPFAVTSAGLLATGLKTSLYYDHPTNRSFAILDMTVRDDALTNANLTLYPYAGSPSLRFDRLQLFAPPDSPLIPTMTAFPLYPNPLHRNELGITLEEEPFLRVFEDGKGTMDTAQDYVFRMIDPDADMFDLTVMSEDTLIEPRRLAVADFIGITAGLVALVQPTLRT